MEDEAIDPNLLDTNNLMKKCGQGELIVFFGKPLRENFIVAQIAERAIKGQVGLIEFTHDGASQFKEG